MGKELPASFGPEFVTSSKTFNKPKVWVSPSVKECPDNDARCNKAGRVVLMMFRIQLGPLRESKCSCTTAL